MKSEEVQGLQINDPVTHPYYDIGIVKDITGGDLPMAVVDFMTHGPVPCFVDNLTPIQFKRPLHPGQRFSTSNLS